MAGRRRVIQTNPNFGMNLPPETGVSETLLQNARRSGQLNISNRSLTEIPFSVWYINEECSRNKETLAFTDNNAERWWEESPLVKLTASSNRIRYIDDNVVHLKYLTSLDLYDNEIESLPMAIGELKELKYLNVSINKLRSFPDNICLCTNLTHLDCHRNAIAVLPSAIGELTELEIMDLSENQLSTLPESFDRLRRLRKLKVKKNKLKSLPVLSSLTSLVQMDLSTNQLVMLPPSFCDLSRLETLDVHANKLEQCPRLSECLYLKELYLGENNIGTIDPSICRLPSLMTLDLHFNKIAEIPSAITSMQSLIRLDLGNNDLTSLPLELGQMKQLKTLVIDGNPMRAIRRDIINRGTEAVKKYLVSRMAEALPVEKKQPTVKDRSMGMGMIGDGDDEVDPHEVERTQALEMIDKNLADIPIDIWEAIRESPIKTINLKRNHLVMMPVEIRWFDKTLVHLDLSVNKLTRLPEEIAMLKKLQHLDVSANRLTGCPNTLSELPNLNHLDLSYNSIKEFPSVVYRLFKLEHLFLGSNEISTLGVDGILKLSRLRTLDLQNNSLDRLPPELGLCEQLSCLKLEGNCFRIPRPSLLAKGTSAVLQYLRDRIQE